MAETVEEEGQHTPSAQGDDLLREPAAQETCRTVQRLDRLGHVLPAERGGKGRCVLQVRRGAHFGDGDRLARKIGVGELFPAENVGERMPDKFPGDFPIYSGSDVLASFAVRDDEQSSTSYFTFLGTDDSPTKVYDYYLDRLGKDP